MKLEKYLRTLISEVTGAKPGDLPLIETIMREEIFHSTLDWQTCDQLMDGARRAMLRLNEDRDLYEYGRSRALAAFQEMRASSDLRPPSPRSGEAGRGGADH